YEIGSGTAVLNVADATLRDSPYSFHSPFKLKPQIAPAPQLSQMRNATPQYASISLTLPQPTYRYVRSPHPAHRRALAVKRYDGEPLTRVDLQYDLLIIFSATLKLYSLTHIPLCVVTLHTQRSPFGPVPAKEKMVELREFGDEFGKISLLSNVGRINTTMAFFPEMRTSLRTYHPVPPLQKTDGNLQDAPRIKNILKSCFLENESQGTVSTPTDVLSRSRSGEVPPTTVVNLIFILASHAGPISAAHFEPNAGVDVVDFFTPVHISSASRARAFLWLCYHYLEAPSPNPFSDEHADQNPGKIPALVTLTAEEAAQENIDSQEEIDWGVRMTHQRQLFVESKLQEEERAREFGREKPKPKAKGARGKGRAKKLVDTASIGRDESPAESQQSLPLTAMDELSLGTRTPQPRISPAPFIMPPMSDREPPYSPPHSPHTYRDMPAFAHPRASADPYPLRPITPSFSQQPSNGKPTRTRMQKQREQRGPFTRHPLSHAHAPYLPPPYVPAPYVRHSYSIPRYTVPPPAPRRSMLEQAWHVVMTTDPLVDSDEEEYADENTRMDYVLRLRIMNRLRGKEPTPEPERLPRSIFTPFASSFDGMH
ncbi:Ino eighty subunit 1, partial [Grifola frondosa]